jgi:ATP-binding cassette subfamily C (CFTR/MRP) protein 4
VYSAPPLPPPSYTTQKSIQSEKEAAAAEEIKQVTLPKEERATGTISFMTYIQYFVAGGGYIFTVFLFILYVINEGILVSTDWWIADWADCDVLSLNFTDNNSTHATCNLTTQQRTGIYFTFVAFVWFISLFRNFLFFFLALRSARVLHNRMFSSILRSPVLFFDTNPIGRVLNRFSKDIGFLDDILIYTFCEFLILMFRFFGILVASIIANPYLAIPVVVLCVVFAAFRWYYLKSARDIKRVEALSRSPLYSHISMTLQGLCTIRAYKMEDIAMTQFHHYQNIHTQAWYLYIASSRWFGYRIDLISSTFISCVCFISIPLAGSINPGLIGLALSYALTLNGMFQYCIRQSAEVESLMVSAERVISYGKLDSEASLETIPPADAPPPDWPTEGQIELKDLCYRHSMESPLVLKGLNCVIRSREKVGIVGRTGAGKSSLIAAIFRLAEPTGSIIIDGIDCLKLGLHDLRSKISIIPQDPVLFTGTIRYNLDPFNSYTDEDIWRSLEQVQLKYQVEVLEGGLEAFVSEGGGNFSVGQRQLFCLARALLRNNKILMLDEATANVDLETDAIIQQVIRHEFSHCTILTIAHRLDTVMDSDKIMVLRFGELIEFGEPHELMSNAESYLLRLVDHTGPIASAKLKEMALDSHNARNKLD